MLEPSVKLWRPGAVLRIPPPDSENLLPAPENRDHRPFSSNAHTTFTSMSNMQPNFPKWIVITVIHAYSSCPFVGGFPCERHCIIFSVGLPFENWSHGALIYQLLCNGPVWVWFLIIQFHHLFFYEYNCISLQRLTAQCLEYVWILSLFSLFIWQGLIHNICWNEKCITDLHDLI